MNKNTLNKLFNEIDSEPFEVTFCDGTKKQYGEGLPSVHLLFNNEIPIDILNSKNDY